MHKLAKVVTKGIKTSCIFISTFAPQKHNVFVLLEVQLRGKDKWLMVKIRCPLRHTNSNGTRLFPACEWRRLTGLGNSDVTASINLGLLLQRCLGNVTWKERCGWTAAGPAFTALSASNWAAAMMSVTLCASTD